MGSEGKGGNRVLDQRQILLSSNPVPRVSLIVSSICAHVVALALIVVFWHAEGAHIVREKYTAVQEITGRPHVSFHPVNTQATRALTSPSHARRSARREPVPGPRTATGDAIQALREQAREATAALVTNLKFRQVYGFSPGHDYQLAIRTSGELPIISAADLPPRFEQYVVVEVTIGIDGRVADDRVVSGIVTPTVEQMLLAAIREFKYTPATRDGSPIPSQVDIVVHIPS